MNVLFVLLALAVLFGVAAAAGGRGGGMAPALPDRPRAWPPDVELRAQDVAALRLPVELRGYRMDRVDEALDRLAAELARRDARIAELQALLAERDSPSDR